MVPIDEAESCFQNVDLDLSFEGDITPLVAGFGSALTELRNLQPRDPDEAISEYWRLIRALRPELRVLWNGCHRRTMNIGVHAPSGRSVEFAGSLAPVERLQELRAELVFTVYRDGE